MGDNFKKIVTNMEFEERLKKIRNKTYRPDIILDPFKDQALDNELNDRILVKKLSEKKKIPQVIPDDELFQ